MLSAFAASRISTLFELVLLQVVDVSRLRTKADLMGDDPHALYGELRQLNARWHCLFYEGLVAKRTTDPYPVQLRSPEEEFVGWVKHRWAY